MASPASKSDGRTFAELNVVLGGLNIGGPEIGASYADVNANAAPTANPAGPSPSLNA